MAKNKGLSGFVEWLPEQQVVADAFVATVRRAFELHGFTHLDLRSVEPLDVLLQKGETDKEVYVLRRLNADASDGNAGLGLHFDLTVPFARFVSENAGSLSFPFKRYQIQPAWRGERPQEGRYREFIQADIDVVDRDSLSLHFDIEMPGLLVGILDSLPVPKVTVRVNNRKLIEGFYRGIGIEDIPSTLRAVDKLDKIGVQGVKRLLVELLPEDVADRVLELATISSADLSFVDRVAALGVSHPLLEQGVAELAAVIAGNAHLRAGSVVADLRIARGLDYYTGTVYEGTMEGLENIGAVCSGGRYDDLVGGSKQKLPGVGVSIGITRILGVLVGRGMLTGSRQSPTAVLVALNDEAHRPAAAAIARALRARDIAAEVFHEPQAYGKQVRYAFRKGIPYVLFDGVAEPGKVEIRDIGSGEQGPVEVELWIPPARALPEIVRTIG